MRVAHKIAKLVDGTAWLSASNAYHRWRHPIDPQEIIKEIDAAGFAKIRDKFSVPGERTHWPKYLDADRWLRLNIRRAQELRLTARPLPVRILDLGSGAGWFLLVARHVGHSGAGLDIPDPPMYGELFELFGLKRTLWEIKAYEPLPDLGERFDMVTAFSICFNGHKRSDLWTPKEWAFLLDDLQKRFLRPGGEIFLGMNPEEDGSFYTPALKQFFTERGAQIDRAKVWLKRVSV